MSALVVPFESSHLTDVREIFFESSTRKEFQSDEEKEAFFYKYVGYYLEHYPDFCFVARDKEVLGYIVGATDSSQKKLHELQPHLEVFNKHFSFYPAHLHINCHVRSRGQGVGAKLVQHLVTKLIQDGVAGVHIITSVDARNQSFYEREGFTFRTEGYFNGSVLLFMGKKLSDN
jgi:ribosomal protein S18 acetylase RimI-like enzyme